MYMQNKRKKKNENPTTTHYVLHKIYTKVYIILHVVCNDGVFIILFCFASIYPHH